jgi:hypothetical protein
MKKTGRGKSTGDVMHIYLGTAHGNSLCTIFISNKQKCHVSLLCVCGFSSRKSENRRVEQRQMWEAGRVVGTSQRREVAEERDRRMNMVSTRYTYVRKCKNDTC